MKMILPPMARHDRMLADVLIKFGIDTQRQYKVCPPPPAAAYCLSKRAVAW